MDDVVVNYNALRIEGEQPVRPWIAPSLECLSARLRDSSTVQEICRELRRLFYSTLWLHPLSGFPFHHCRTSVRQLVRKEEGRRDSPRSSP
jgi:hypothetical protein